MEVKDDGGVISLPLSLMIVASGGGKIFETIPFVAIFHLKSSHYHQ